ncbi:pncA [Symbiodinium sp. CCMP2592]|nr:pncA [Symbiodinium sp. CCMP2592]
MEWLSAAVEAVSSLWEDPAPPQKDFPRTLEGFEKLLSLVADGLTTSLPHLPSQADALAEQIEHLGFASPGCQLEGSGLSYSEEKGTGFFRVFQERKVMALLVQHGLLAQHTLRRVRAALFRTVKDESFPHLLDQLNQLAQGQHRPRLRWVFGGTAGGDRFPDPAEARDPGQVSGCARQVPRIREIIKADLIFRATEGNYIAALKRMALRLTPQPDAHRADRFDRNADQFLDVRVLGVSQDFEGRDLLSSLPSASPRPQLGAKLPLMEEADISAARYVFHGYDMAQIGSRVVCLCLLKSKNPRATGMHLTIDGVSKRVDQQIAAGAGRTAALRLGGVACIIVADNSSALQAALAKEKDVLDFITDLVSLGQPAAVAELIVCGPLLSQLHVLAAPVWLGYVNRPKSIWEASDMLAIACACLAWCFWHAEILMMDVENNGPVPSPECVDAMQAAEAERACAAEEAKLGSLANFLQRMQTERLSGVVVPLIQLLLWPVAVPAALAESKACGTQGRAREILIGMSWRELQCAAVFSKLGTAIGESGLWPSCAQPVEWRRQKCTKISCIVGISTAAAARQMFAGGVRTAALVGRSGFEIALAQIFWEKGISNPFRGAVQAMLHDQSMMGVSGVSALRMALDGAAGRAATTGIIKGQRQCIRGVGVVAGHFLRNRDVGGGSGGAENRHRRKKSIKREGRRSQLCAFRRLAQPGRQKFRDVCRINFDTMLQQGHLIDGVASFLSHGNHFSAAHNSPFINFDSARKEAVEAVSSLWEAQPRHGHAVAVPAVQDFPRTLEGFEKLPVARLSLVADGLTTSLPHLPSQADVALAEQIEHLGFASPGCQLEGSGLSYSEEKGTGFFRVFQERKVMALLVQHGLLAQHTLRRVRAALFRTVKDESFPHLLDQLNQLAQGQHRPRLRWVFGGTAGGDRFPDPAEARDPGQVSGCARQVPRIREIIKADLIFRATEGNYIAALKRMALRLTPQPDAHRADRFDRNADQFLDATAGPEGAKLPLMEEAARYVFHGYDMAQIGSRVVCLCLLKSKNPRVHGAAVEVLTSKLLPELAERLHCAWAQMATAMQQDNSSALQAALAKEKDVLDFITDLVSLGQPAVTQAVAELIVCGPLLSQLHVLAARHRYVNRPKSIWEILMMDVENNGPVPSPECVDAMQAAEAERACAAEEDPPDQLAAVLAVRSLANFLQRMQTERLSGVVVPLIQLLLWPAVPAALAESKGPANADKTRAAVQALAELCTACGVEEAALATSEVSAQQRSSERQIWLRDCTGADLLGKEKGISNPFRVAVQVRAFLASLSQLWESGNLNSRASASMVPCAAVASYLLHQCQDIHPMLLETSGLLPKKADTAEPSV